MPFSLVNRYHGLGEVCCLHLQDMGLLHPKCWCTPITHSSTLLMTDAGGYSETILHTYQITRYMPEKDHLHHNAWCHIPKNRNFNAYHNLNITVKRLNLIHSFITHYPNWLHLLPTYISVRQMFSLRHAFVFSPYEDCYDHLHFLINLSAPILPTNLIQLLPPQNT
jgi:hypothetical protein